MSIFSTLLNGVSADPLLLISQMSVVIVAVLLLFLLFYALRDVLLRSHSLAFQFLSILLVAVVPVLGFLIYLLIRPARTVRQRQADKECTDLWQHFCAPSTDESHHGDDDAPAPTPSPSSTPSV